MRSRISALLIAASLAGTAGAGAQITQAEFAQRRAALAARLTDGVFVARGAEEPVVDYNSFYQSPGFLYLTGYREPGSALMMTKRGNDVRWTLFVAPKNPAVEVWSGRRNGPEVASRLTGLDARLAGDFDAVLDSLLSSAREAWILADVSHAGDTLNGDDDFVRGIRERHQRLTVRSANEDVLRLRGTKSGAELELLRKSVAITLDAHREAMRALEPGVNEFEIQAIVEYSFRRNGADRPSFASIVGSGPNSTVLHYNRNDRFTRDGDMLVLDIGSSYMGYAADVTRSFPVSGTFSPEQRAVYQIVRDAQAAGERNARPGMTFRGASDSARAVIAAGLTRLGLIESPTATWDCGQPRPCLQVSLYYMHGLGHGIGLEVHDPDQSDFSGIIAAGSAFSIEPGIYVRENVLEIIGSSPRNAALRARIADAVRRYSGVGVRIEDDYVVTESGLEWISCGLPREIDEIEKLMREAPSLTRRNPQPLEWYRAAERGEAMPALVPDPSCVRM